MKELKLRTFDGSAAFEGSEGGREVPRRRPGLVHGVTAPGGGAHHPGGVRHCGSVFSLTDPTEWKQISVYVHVQRSADASDRCDFMGSSL